MAGIDFMSLAKGAEYANLLNQKDDSYYRQRETDLFNFDKAQQEFAQKQQDYGLADDARVAGESMLNLNQSVKRLVNETGIDPAQAWIQALKNASLEGGTPRQQALFQQSLQKHASILAAEAARAGRIPEADRFLTAAGLPSLMDSEGIALAQDPAKRDAFLETRGFSVVDGKVRLSDGKEYDAGLIAAQLRTGGGTLAMSMAERNKYDEAARLAGEQTAGLTAQQVANAGNAKQEIAINLAKTKAGLVAAGQPYAWVDALAQNYGVNIGSQADYQVAQPTAQTVAPVPAIVPAQITTPVVAQPTVQAPLPNTATSITEASTTPIVYPAPAAVPDAATLVAQRDALNKIERELRSKGVQIPPDVLFRMKQRYRDINDALLTAAKIQYNVAQNTTQAEEQARKASLQTENANLVAQLQQLLK